MTARITCLFSGLTGANPGGVQGSGRTAWQAITGYLASQGEGANLVVYGEADSADVARARRAFVDSRRWQLLQAALLRDWRAPLLCFWHVGMLRLLPLLRPGSAEVALFLHGIEVWRPLGRLLRPLVHRVDRFLVNSTFTWKQFLRYNPQYSDRPHCVVALGVDQPMVGEVPPPRSPPAALVLGRILRSEGYKGHRQLLRVWPEICRRVPGAELWVAGDGDLVPELKSVAERLQLGGTVRFLGRISEAEKAWRLAACRVLALPSKAEGFGLVYLEAMRLGRPCLVSDCDAGREVVNPPEAGLAVNPDDPTALTAALARLLTAGPEWQRWSEQARRRYESRFTADHFQGRLLEALFSRMPALTVQR